MPITGEAPRVFKCDEDIWDVVKLLIAEVKETNKKMGKSFDIVNSISYQLSFFSCPNIVLKNQFQNDISQYAYCKEFGISAFPGSYRDQPAKWISKASIIKVAMNKREEKLQKQANKNAEIKSKGKYGN